MAYCVVCGTGNADDARFCINCGAELGAAAMPEAEADAALETVEKKVVETVEENGDVVVTETEVKVEVPKKKGRKKKADPKEKKEEKEPEASKTEALPKDAGDGADSAFAFEPPVVTEESKERQQEETETFLDALIDDAGEGACGPDAESEPGSEQPEAIDAYIPPVSTDAADVYRPQFAASPYSEPTRIGEPVNINTSLPPVAPSAPLVPAPVYQLPAQQVVEEEKVKAVSTAGFFWLDVLYLIPGVGLVMSIILSLAAGNKNIKSHARAVLIIRIIICVLLLIVAVVLILLDRQYGIFYDSRRYWLQWPGWDY